MKHDLQPVEAWTLFRTLWKLDISYMVYGDDIYDYVYRIRL